MAATDIEIRDEISTTFDLDRLLALLQNPAAPIEYRRLAFEMLMNKYSHLERVAYHLRSMANELAQLGLISGPQDLSCAHLPTL